jgi:hypothetical protein
MVLSHTHRFIFIHVSKTGGMSVRAALEPYSAEPEKFVMRRPSKMTGDRANPLYKVWETLLLHAKASDAKKELPPEVFERYFKFAFVRNPWDLMVSMYHFILREPEARNHGQVKALGSFEAFVEWAVSTPEPFPKGTTRLQSEMIVGADGKLLVDFVGAYENLGEDFDEIARITGIRAVLPHVNQSLHRDYRTCYNERTRAIVAEHVQPDIERFGYSFDGSPSRLVKGVLR